MIMHAVVMEVIELNVGGRVFITTKATLCKFSDSRLAAMFSGNMQPGQRDNQGRIFIDRNGDWFATILAYLRGEAVEFPFGDIQRQALTIEAQYFQVPYKCHTAI